MEEEEIQYYSCFISYSSKHEAFAKRLHAGLQNSDVRRWFAPHDLPIGTKTWDAIDAAIRVCDKVLLILSKSAIASQWVEDELCPRVKRLVTKLKMLSGICATFM